MSHRTTFALDAATATRLKRLATRWRVSQAEVVRRAVAQAEVAADKPNPIAMLKALHETKQGLDPKAARAYIAQVREDRSRWRGK